MTEEIGSIGRTARKQRFRTRRPARRFRDSGGVANQVFVGEGKGIGVDELVDGIRDFCGIECLSEHDVDLGFKGRAFPGTVTFAILERFGERLGALVGLSVKDRDLTVPPADPVDGDRYLVPLFATGAWTGRTDQVAVCIAGTWEYHTPKTGWVCFIEDEERLSVFKSGGWSAGIAV